MRASPLFLLAVIAPALAERSRPVLKKVLASRSETTSEPPLVVEIIPVSDDEPKLEWSVTSDDRKDTDSTVSEENYGRIIKFTDPAHTSNNAEGAGSRERKGSRRKNKKFPGLIPPKNKKETTREYFPRPVITNEDGSKDDTKELTPWFQQSKCFAEVPQYSETGNVGGLKMCYDHLSKDRENRLLSNKNQTEPLCDMVYAGVSTKLRRSTLPSREQIILPLQEDALNGIQWLLDNCVEKDCDGEDCLVGGVVVLEPEKIYALVL